MIHPDTIVRSEFGQPTTPITVVVHYKSEQSPILSKGTIYKFQSDVACHILFGDDPVATRDNDPLAANRPYFYTPKNDYKVAVTRGGQDNGTLWITQMDGRIE